MSDTQNSKTPKSHWIRKFVAEVLSLLLILSVIILFFQGRFKPPKSISATDAMSQLLSTYRAPESVKTSLPWDFDYSEMPPYDFNANDVTPQKKSKKASGLEITSGDIIGTNTGGRAKLPDGSAAYDSDDRLWVDARIPIAFSSKLKFYGATTFGLEVGDTFSATNALSKENLSIGGGFGFSYKLSENAELIFDYRLSQPMETDSIYDTTNSAGFSIRLSF